MRLIVIACDKPVAVADGSGAWTVRLAGAALSDDRQPPNLSLLADEAAREVRETFPAWLWQWCRTHSALDVQVWPGPKDTGPVSWWWYTPISEKSPLRSAFIRELYWLALLKKLIRQLHVETLEWHGDDPLLAAAVRQVADQQRLPILVHLSGFPWRRRISARWVRRILYSLGHGLRWALIKWLGYGKTLKDSRHDTAFFTLYPSLWEFKEHNGTARMYGSLPQFLTKQGHSAFYPVAYQGTARALLFQRRLLLQRCRDNRILFLESQLSLADWLRAHIMPGFMFRYLPWRRAHRKHTIFYGEIDVARLWWRELDANALSPEIPFDVALSNAFTHLLSQRPGVKTLFHHFEYQPMERALINGARQAGPIRIVGLQAGMFTSNQMGFIFPAEEAQITDGNGYRAPVPDYLAAYRRVCWSGPIRYPAFSSQPEFDRDAFIQAHRLPQDARFITVTTSIVREESLALLQAAFQILAWDSTVYLLIKFHYHTPLFKEATQLARRSRMDRYRIFDTDLVSLLQTAPLMLCAGSSTAMEAIGVGCMPLVYRPIGEMPCNPMLDIPESVFFWNTPGELQQAINSCLEKDRAYTQRRERWPQAITAQMSPSDGSANARLYEFLHVRSAL